MMLNLGYFRKEVHCYVCCLICGTCRVAVPSFPGAARELCTKCCDKCSGGDTSMQEGSV